MFAYLCALLLCTQLKIPVYPTLQIMKTEKRNISENKPRVALSLSSGGARGMAHIGAIMALEEQGFVIHSISGCSIGSLIGGIFAAGKIHEARDWFCSLDKQQILSLTDLSLGLGHIVKGEKVLNAIKEWVPDQNIEELSIPAAFVATDLLNSRPVVFRSGSLFNAIRASISIPLCFKPFRYNDTLLVDGGLVNPFPLDIVQRDDNDILAGMNISGRTIMNASWNFPNIPSAIDKLGRVGNRVEQWLDKMEEGINNSVLSPSVNAFSLTNRMIDIQIQANCQILTDQCQPDILAVMPQDEYTTFDFDKAGEIIDKGHELMCAAIERFRNRAKTLFLTGLFLAGLASSASNASANDALLTGIPIGSSPSVEYTNYSATTTQNLPADAFDGDLSTFFASYERSYTWVGLDLGTPHVITRVGWSPRNDGLGPGRVQLGVFEGSDTPDFINAIPIYIIDTKGTIGVVSHADVTCSKGFRYVRYVGPSDARCNIAEVEFYGHPGTGDNSNLYQITNLPTVSIHTVNGVIPRDKVTDISSTINIISGNGTRLLSETAGIRERGNASRNFPKKPYRIKFDKKQQVLDAPSKAKSWTLINNYGDKTLIRNLIAFEISRTAGLPYTPYGTMVDVLLNGEYKGCYQLCDKIQVRNGRVDIDEMTPRDNSGDALTGGYLIEVDAYASDGVSYFYSNQGTPVTIHHPSEDSITTTQKQYIRQCYNNMESNWQRYLDTNTFLRHFIVGEMSGNTDTYWSVYMYKKRLNDTIFTGPVWDFDLAFENDQRTYPINNKSDYIYRSGGSTTGNMRTFTDRIVINDAASKRQLVAIWDEIRHNGLTEERLINYIDSLASEIYDSQRLNFIRWPILNERVHQNPRTWGGFDGEVDNVKRYIRERLTWMDTRLG